MSEQTANLCTTDAAEAMRETIADQAREIELLRAKASQVGEAVEVVAYMEGNGRLWNDTTHPGRMTQLMTVAQHQRILAASVGSAEPVAMKTHGAWDGLDDLANLPDGTKLYTHPADQVDDDLTMVKVSRELLVKLLDEGRRAETWAAQEELRTLLAKPCQHIQLTSQYGTWCELCETKLD